MTLVLTILRCPDGVPPEIRRIEHGELSIGRGRDSDWVLPDPDRLLSKRHCVVAQRDGAWELTDTSTNGIIVNHEPVRLGRNNTRALRDGDRLILGAYEIEVGLRGSALRDTAAKANLARAAAREAMDETAGGEIDLPIDLPDDDRLGIAMAGPGEAWDEDPFASPLPAPDHAPVGAEHFSPPAIRFDILPTDWDRDLLTGVEPAQGAPRTPAPPPLAARSERRPAPSEPAGPALPAPWLPTEAAQGSPASAQAEPTPAAPPTPETPLPTDAAASPPAVRSAPPPPPLQQVPSPDARAISEAYAAFLAGAGISAAAPADIPAALHELGAAFRTVVSGLRQIIIARAAIKGEFRIEQTVIRHSGNNPLKFSADDDDALQALLGGRRLGDMPAERALSEAMRDMHTHEIAVSTAMQQATRDLMAALAPARVERDLPPGALDGLPGAAALRKARGWDAYTTLHGRIMQALNDDFDNVFGKSFVRAYEQAMAELNAPAGSGRNTAAARRPK